MPAASAPKLIVRAFAGDQQIGEDVSRPKPTHDEVINFEIPAPVLSEWERLCHGVLPLLLGQGEGDHALPPWEINDHDRDYIAEETGLDKEQIRLWALAFGRDAAVVLQSGDVTSTNRTEIHTHLDSISADGLSNFAIFYGWFRLGAESSSLWTTPTDKLITNLKAAIDQHIVPSNISGKLDGISARIEQIKLDRILEAPVLGSTTSLPHCPSCAPTTRNWCSGSRMSRASMAMRLA